MTEWEGVVTVCFSGIVKGSVFVLFIHLGVGFCFVVSVEKLIVIFFHLGGVVLIFVESLVFGDMR